MEEVVVTQRNRLCRFVVIRDNAFLELKKNLLTEMEKEMRFKSQKQLKSADSSKRARGYN